MPQVFKIGSNQLGLLPWPGLSVQAEIKGERRVVHEKME